MIQCLREYFPPLAQRWRPFGDLLPVIMLVMISTDISIQEMSGLKCQSLSVRYHLSNTAGYTQKHHNESTVSGYYRYNSLLGSCEFSEFSVDLFFLCAHHTPSS